jgi:hypothetical protein
MSQGFDSAHSAAEPTGQVRSGLLLGPKPETMRVTRQLGLPPRYRRPGFESSYAHSSNRSVWHSTAFQIANYAMKPVIREACPRAGRCSFGAHAARATFASETIGSICNAVPSYRTCIGDQE